MDTSHLYCPKCGEHKFFFRDDSHWVCSECDFTLYRNVAAAAGAFLRVDNEFLVLTRNRNPGKGKLDVPGGFIDVGETLEEGLRREIREEIGLEIDHCEYLCGQPNLYEFKGITYHTMDVYFEVRFSVKPELFPDKDEVATARWVSIDDFDFNDFAFPSTREAVKVFSSRACRKSR